MSRESSSRISSRARARIATVAGCLFAIAMTGSGAALAADAEPDGAPSVAVNYADLDLTTERGAKALYARIAAAAQTVCPRADIADLIRYAKSRACQRHAIAQAVQRVGSPKLAAVLARHPEPG